MKPLSAEAYKLLDLVITASPYTAKVGSSFMAPAPLSKAKRKLESMGLIDLTGEKGQWERMFPTQSGRLFHRWQAEAVEAAKEQQKRLKYLKPEDDGRTHINVYSKGATELGRYLSNFQECELLLPEGKFKSVEGYWYYLLLKEKDPSDAIGLAQLSRVHGAAAKVVGRKLVGKFEMPPEFKAKFRAKITHAIAVKIIGDDRLQAILEENTLPFEHYYVYAGKVVEPKEHKWLLAATNSLAQIVSSRPTVHNLYKNPDWEQDPDAVYIGRPGKGQSGYFGNPAPKTDTPGEASAKFEVYARWRARSDSKWREQVKGLLWKKLMCFCGNEHCHGHKLAKLAVEWSLYDA